MGAAGDVVAGGGVVSHSDEDDLVEGGVGLAVAASVEASSGDGSG